MEKKAVNTAREIVERVEKIRDSIGLTNNPYFVKLRNGEMSRDAFVGSQRQFYFAVDFFSRPMSALLMRISSPGKRLPILKNVVEEHGDFRPNAFHESTFRDFLAAMGEESTVDSVEMHAPVHAFNCTVMAACLVDPLPTGIACLGFIEYTFAEISAMIAASVVERGWIARDSLAHYSLHAELDKRHAADFFGLVEADWEDRSRRPLVERGLRLGGYAFHGLYRDLHMGNNI